MNIPSILFTCITSFVLMFFLIKRKQKILIFWLSVAYILVGLAVGVLDQIFKMQILNKVSVEEIFLMQDVSIIVSLIQVAFLLGITIYVLVNGINSKKNCDINKNDTK